MFKAISRICDDNQLLISFRCSQDWDQSTGLWAQEEKLQPGNSLTRHCPNEKIFGCVHDKSANAKVVTFMAQVFLAQNHIPGIECLSVIIVVIIRRGMGCFHQATLAAASTHIYWGQGSTYLHPPSFIPTSISLPWFFVHFCSAICPCPLITINKPSMLQLIIRWSFIGFNRSRRGTRPTS